MPDGREAGCGMELCGGIRFRSVCYRAHDPRVACKPLSGAGAAESGDRMNPIGTPALYLSLDLLTAVVEANQGAEKILPCCLCAYEVDVAAIADLREEAGRDAHDAPLSALGCEWEGFAARGEEPPSWRIARRLMARGLAGALLPSFVPSAGAGQNLVLWRWGGSLPHRVAVHDPVGRLPRDGRSWEEAESG